MNSLKSKAMVTGLLLAGSSLVSAHPGSHGASSWHHHLTSPDHAAVVVLVALIGLGIVAYLVRKSSGAISSRNKRE